MGHPLYLANAWLKFGYDAARVLALLLVLGVTIAAGVTAARQTPARGSRLPLADARARQGVATGLCAGTAAALLVCVLGVSTIALLPQETNRLTWTLPYRYTIPTTLPPYRPYRHGSPDGVYKFEVGASDSAAGFLVVLLAFPLFGAGLGAWGGLYGAGQPRRRPGGGGGGGPKGPPPVPPPPDRGVRVGDENLPAILRGGYLRELPATEGLEPAPEQEPVAPSGADAEVLSAPQWALGCGDGGEPGQASG